MNDDWGIPKSLRFEWLRPTIVVTGCVFLCLLVVGIVLKSLLLEVGGALALAATIGYGVMKKPHDEDITGAPEPYEPKTSNQTLLFDDFQSDVVVHIAAPSEKEPVVVPSTKAARPVQRDQNEAGARHVDIPDFFDFETEVSYTDVEPRSEFHALIDKVLLVLKDVFFAHSVAFFWANNDKKEMVLESMATVDPLFMKTRRFNMGSDLVTQVGSTGKPRLVGSVNAASEKDLLPYYDAPSGVKSAVGVPVFYANNGTDVVPVGVIVVDSLAEDQYGEETLVVLGRFTKLISVLIKSYTDKYDLLLDAELLASIRRMHDRTGTSPTEESVLTAMTDEANRLATWECLALVLFDEKRNGWTVQRVQNRGEQAYVGVDQAIDADASIVGEVILSNCIKVVDDLKSEKKPRFHASEPATDAGSLLCLPVSSFNRCYGALCLESRRVRNFQKNETETMFRLVQNAASMLEVVYMNDVIKEHVPIDHTTGALTRRHFERRLKEEVDRATDLDSELSLVSIAIDHPEEQVQRYGQGAIDAMIGSVAAIVRSNLRSYDVVGRESDTRLNVLLVSTPASDAYLWAEKIRKAIAGQVVVSGTRSFSTTVSVGICGLLDGMVVDDLAEGTRHVLDKAMEHGGNLVRVY